MINFCLRKGRSIMEKKYLIRALVLSGIIIAGFTAPKAVKADALPCTVMYLNQAKEAQAAATAELSAAQALLTEKQRKRITMHFYEGMTYREIAELESTGLSTVQDSIDLAKEKVKNFFEKNMKFIPYKPHFHCS